MNNIFSPEQESKTGNLDSNLIVRQYKLGLLARFLENKYLNQKLGQDQIANDLGCTTITLQQ